MFCNDCKRYFVEDEATVTVEREVGYKEVLCPYCGSDDLEESHRCKCCGEQTVNEFCDYCMESIAEELLDLQRRFDITGDVLEELIVAHYEL